MDSGQKVFRCYTCKAKRARVALDKKVLSRAKISEPTQYCCLGTFDINLDNLGLNTKRVEPKSPNHESLASNCRARARAITVLMEAEFALRVGGGCSKEVYPTGEAALGDGVLKMSENCWIRLQRDYSTRRANRACGGKGIETQVRADVNHCGSRGDRGDEARQS
jgi:hypothetical protein